MHVFASSESSVKITRSQLGVGSLRTPRVTVEFSTAVPPANLTSWHNWVRRVASAVDIAYILRPFKSRSPLATRLRERSGPFKPLACKLGDLKLHAWTSKWCSWTRARASTQASSHEGDTIQHPNARPCKYVVPQVCAINRASVFIITWVVCLQNQHDHNTKYCLGNGWNEHTQRNQSSSQLTLKLLKKMSLKDERFGMRSSCPSVL